MADPTDLRRSAPAALRNRDLILDVLRSVLPSAGLVLEVASGTGEHVVHFARELPALDWQPSDPSPAARKSIAAWTEAEKLGNIREVMDLDAAGSPWPVDQVAAVICINMIHISPWESTIGLMRGAGQALVGGGALYLYGPYRRSDRPLEPGNLAFDQNLRVSDARWGLRNLDTVIQCAASHGLGFERAIDMPANNLSVIFRRS
jgi:SAM-dependent methyltransferase